MKAFHTISLHVLLEFTVLDYQNQRCTGFGSPVDYLDYQNDFLTGD